MQKTEVETKRASGWRRVLYGVNAAMPPADERGDAQKEPRWISIAATLLVPLLAAGAGFAGASAGSWWQTEDNRQTIEAERRNVVEQFQRDQRQTHYAEILQQATRLENASDFSVSAFAAGLIYSDAYRSTYKPNDGYGNYYTGGSAAGEMSGGTTTSEKIALGILGSEKYGNTYAQPSGSGMSWRDAYTALDQAISNAEIAGTDETVGIARALRDRYRNDYFDSITPTVTDSTISHYPDPKPTKEQLVNAIVGVPDKSESANYGCDPLVKSPEECDYLRKSTPELTKLYVDSAELDLAYDK